MRRKNKQKPSHLVQGTIKRHSDGFGFLLADDRTHPDVYIPRHSMDGVMTRDKVLVSVQPGGDRTRLSGEIVEIIEHNTKTVVGRYHGTSATQGMIVDEESIWGEDLQVFNPLKLPVKNSELVAIQVNHFPGSEEGFQGNIVEILGSHGDPLTDTKRVIYGHRIPMEFSAEAQKEASRLPKEVTETDFKDRVDLRNKAFITIDGATAKDFDDAVYVEKTNKGFILWVAIADVSHYVKAGSPLDKDAYERGNSTYFPHFVVPMLPEALSNELCSLKPRVPRLSVVAEMQIGFDGSPQSTKFYEAVIQSKHRVTYGQAQEVIDGAAPGELNDVAAMIKELAGFAKILMSRRFKRGSLDLNIADSQVQIDDAGNPVDIVKTERLFAHRLIEECMLAANVAIATFFIERDLPAIYRVHAEPAGENLKSLESFIHAFGGKGKLKGGELQKKITQALEDFKDHPQGQILNILALRSLKQAEYSADNIGHFGLGFENYTHFTSPIRRYADLIVHRVLKSAIIKNKKYPKVKQEDLDTAGTHISACEQRSVKAERQFVSIKKARFLSKFIGKEFDGIISSVTKFGVFVLLREYDVDGLIKVDELGMDKWEFIPERLMLVGKKSKRMYKIGDPIRIVVNQADPDLGQVDFLLAGKRSEKAAPTKGTEHKASSVENRYGERVEIKTFDPSRFDRPSGGPKFGTRIGFGKNPTHERRSGTDRRKPREEDLETQGAENETPERKSFKKFDKDRKSFRNEESYKKGRGKKSRR
ncbi:MAG: ribonuclease R [Bdellovibrionales bacterium]